MTDTFLENLADFIHFNECFPLKEITFGKLNNAMDSFFTTLLTPPLRN